MVTIQLYEGSNGLIGKPFVPTAYNSMQCFLGRISKAVLEVKYYNDKLCKTGE